MKKIFTLLSLIIAGTNFVSAQNEKKISDCEYAPVISGSVKNSQTPIAMGPVWNVLYNYDLFAATGANGNAGVCFLNNQFWVSRWASDTLLILDMSGNLVSKFTVAGVTGTRSLTTDGTFIYAGINTNSIKKIDATAKTLISSITAPIANVRSLTYDATANSNAGGFWISTWGTDITQIDMNGTTLSTVPASSHALTGMYGTAYDKTSNGGPYLWVFDQAHNATNKSDIVQINIASQNQTAVFHDVMSDVGSTAADTSGLAGGLYVQMLSANTVAVIGTLQGSPTNRLFGYSFTNDVSVHENGNANNMVSIFPNPVKDLVNIHIDKKNNDEVQLQIFDVTGKAVFNKATRGLNNYINLSNYNSGLYFVRVTFQGNTYSTKLVKE